MTDTQEAMREPAVKQFETLYGLGAWVDMDNEREAFLSGINYAAAQSAEKIAALEKLRLATQLKLIAAEEKIARLEAAVLNQMIFRAAAELSNKQLREALFAAQGFIHNGIELGYVRMPDADTPDPAHETPRIIAEALIQQPSTEALDAYVAKLVPPGWKVVPIEPSHNMVDHANTAAKAANISISGRLESAEAIERVLLRSAYVAMIDAAPLPPAPEKE